VDLAEEVELPLEVKKEVLFTHARLAELTHWKLLDVPWNAPVEQVQNAYREKVKVFHTDRWGTRGLGSFKARMEAVFRRLTEARDVLVDPVRREGYVLETAPPQERARLQLHKLDDERRAAERRARVARQNPMVKRVAQGQEVVARAKLAMSEGRWKQAMNDFETAAGVDPRNRDEWKRLAEEARRKFAVSRAAEEYERGLKAELAGQPATALELLRRAADLDPQNGHIAAATSRAARAAGALDAARESAERAVHLAPREAESHLQLAEVLHALGLGREAKKAVEKALELDPAHAGAKDLARKLRWTLF
jgi:tetratricopeptide (TPR) repeat protein